MNNSALSLCGIFLHHHPHVFFFILSIALSDDFLRCNLVLASEKGLSRNLLEETLRLAGDAVQMTQFAAAGWRRQGLTIGGYTTLLGMIAQSGMRTINQLII
jgi:hypothetical protein